MSDARDRQRPAGADPGVGATNPPASEEASAVVKGAGLVREDRPDEPLGESSDRPDALTAAHKNKARAPVKPLDFRTLVLSAGGLGFGRPAPGTWGSAPPAALAGALMLGGAPAAVYYASIAGLLLLSCVGCVAFGAYGERRFGRKDAAEIVLDETAGACLPLLAVSPALLGGSFVEVGGYAALACVGAFVLFRVFDVVKPWPARGLERLPAGWGVLLDDLAAGVYASAAMAVLMLVLGLWSPGG